MIHAKIQFGGQLYFISPLHNFYRNGMRANTQVTSDQNVMYEQHDVICLIRWQPWGKLFITSANSRRWVGEESRLSTNCYNTLRQTTTYPLKMQFPPIISLRETCLSRFASLFLLCSLLASCFIISIHSKVIGNCQCCYRYSAPQQASSSSRKTGKAKWKKKSTPKVDLHGQEGVTNAFKNTFLRLFSFVYFVRFQDDCFAYQ